MGISPRADSRLLYAHNKFRCAYAVRGTLYGSHYWGSNAKGSYPKPEGCRLFRFLNPSLSYVS